MNGDVSEWRCLNRNNETVPENGVEIPVTNQKKSLTRIRFKSVQYLHFV